MSITQWEMGDDIARGIVDYDDDRESDNGIDDEWDYPENTEW